jgi:N-acetylneuraminic acid mutarotase
VYDSGYPDQLGRATDTVQVYSPATHQWYYICPMKEHRAYHGVATWRDKIYVIGGENEKKK